MMTPVCPRLLNLNNDFVLLRFWARAPEDLSAIEVIYIIIIIIIVHSMYYLQYLIWVNRHISLYKGPYKCYVTQYGMGGCQISWKKVLRRCVINVTRWWWVSIFQKKTLRNRAISWYSFCVGQDICRLFSIIEIILGNYQQVWTGQMQVL